jgi:hypothetical protein
MRSRQTADSEPRRRRIPEILKALNEVEGQRGEAMSISRRSFLENAAIGGLAAKTAVGAEGSRLTLMLILE